MSLITLVAGGRMRINAAASASLRPILASPLRPARWLGACPAAIYLAPNDQPGVLAVLTRDAVRLPCAVRLPSTSAELPLTSLAADQSTCFIGAGAVCWRGKEGWVEITVVREWAPCLAAVGTPDARAIAQVRTELSGAADRIESEVLAVTHAAADPQSWVPRLVGRGTGLTPSGDDLLAGFLVGAHAFALASDGLRAAVSARAPASTTALSAALLRHAARGECIDEVAGVAEALTGHRAPDTAARRLLTVGHSSGPALCLGLVLAAEQALHDRAAAA